DVNSDSNGLSSTRVDNTAKTTRPQPMSNTKNDRVPSVSKSSCSKNKEVEVEEHSRNLLLSKSKKRMSSECNNVKLPIRNDKSEVVYAMCKQCLITANHDICVLNYVNDMNSHGVISLRAWGTTSSRINYHEMVSAFPICLMARATSTKSWLWHQRLSHLNFDTINDLAKNDLVIGLPKFKYHKEYLCPSCEQGKSKRASHPPKPVPNSKQRLHLLHMDLCGPIRIESINGNQYVLVIVDDYSLYTWVHFLRSKNEAPEVIKTFLKIIIVLLQSPVIIIRTDNDTKLKNQILKAYFDSVGFSHQASFSLQLKDKTIMETMNVTFDELSVMAFEQSSSKPRLQSMTSRQISSGLDLTYAPSTTTTQKQTEGELDLLFEAMYDDYIGVQPSATPRTAPAAQALPVLQTTTTTTMIADTAPTPTNSSSQATNSQNTSQDVDEIETQQQHVQHQLATIADNVPNAMFDDNTFVNPFATPSTSAAESSSS
nr:retrovirus-related Pol polyprotein from transposon TNT 1-94 [Tanacetum cinerariifolium]